jgi:hypothetical protein
MSPFNHELHESFGFSQIILGKQLNPNAKIKSLLRRSGYEGWMTNECQMTKCQKVFLLLFCHLNFGFHFNFEL